MKKIFSGISKYFRGVVSEMKKVVWPTRAQLINNTTVVLVAILIIGIAIWVLDAAFGFSLRYVLPSAQ